MTGVQNFDPTILLALVSALGLLGGIGLGIKALVERNALNATAKASQSKAGNDDATAASIVAAAARELIDPLRRELATEREEGDVLAAAHRVKVLQLQEELDTANRDAAMLRDNLHQTLLELESTKKRLMKRDAQILRLEREIARYQEARYLNTREDDGGLASDPYTK
jgi:predicted  nucleic acid-binding Zn-ribbon protein